MVVPVLMTSCHVSEKWKSGPGQGPHRDDGGATKKEWEWPTTSAVLLREPAKPAFHGLVYSG